MSRLLALSAIACLCSFAYGQQAVTATVNTQYMVDAPASVSLGMAAPIQATAITDSLITMNIQAFPISAPVAMVIDRSGTLGTTIVINAWNMFNIQMDIRDVGGNGYADQVLFDGYNSPTANTMTNAAGQFSAVASMASCVKQANIPTCTQIQLYNKFEISSQAIVNDPTNPPFNVRSTAAIQGTFRNGYKKFQLNDSLAIGEDFGIFPFRNGFTFNFYGVNYTRAFVSSNGHISFGAVDQSFPNPSVNNVLSGVPRIMSYYTDLSPEINTFANPTRIYAQQFRDPSGLMKVKFVHEYVAEFSNVSGPHGGEIMITDNDDIAVYVHGYQGPPSINTVVGITPGNNVDPNVFGFGPDLSALHGTLTARGLGKSAFELFDHGLFPINNPIDLNGFANSVNDPIGRGIKFLKNPSALNTTPFNSSYIIQ